MGVAAFFLGAPSGVLKAGESVLLLEDILVEGKYRNKGLAE